MQKSVCVCGKKTSWMSGNTTDMLHDESLMNIMGCSCCIALHCSALFFPQHLLCGSISALLFSFARSRFQVKAQQRGFSFHLPHYFHYIYVYCTSGKLQFSCCCDDEHKNRCVVHLFRIYKRKIQNLLVAIHSSSCMYTYFVVLSLESNTNTHSTTSNISAPLNVIISYSFNMTLMNFLAKVLLHHLMQFLLFFLSSLVFFLANVRRNGWKMKDIQIKFLFSLEWAAK